MYLAYVDDSGDRETVVLAAVIVSADHWLQVHDQLVAFRSQLSKATGFRMRKELKATELVSGGGGWHGLSPVPALRARYGIYKAALRALADLSPLVRVLGIVIPHRNDPRLNAPARLEAWEKLMERLERLCFYSTPPTTCLMIPDDGSAGGLTAMARRKRRFGYAPPAFGGAARPVPFVQLVDDPMPKDSKTSYLMQWADLVAYAAFRQVMSLPSVPNRLWDELGPARHTEANEIERTRKGSLEPPGLIVWPSRMKPGSQL